MLIDSLVSFIPPGATLSAVAAAGVDIPSNIIDLLGLGVGVAPESIIGNRTTFGSDPGIGWPRAQAQVSVTTAFATANAATLNIAYQGAAEDAVTHLPVAWNTIIESGEIAVTDLDAIGDIAFQFDFEPTHPLNFMPRFLRVLLQIPAATNFTTGAVTIPVTTGLDQVKNLYTPRNFVVGAP